MTQLARATRLTRGSVNSPGRASWFMGDSINSFVTQSADSLPQTSVNTPYIFVSSFVDLGLRKRQRAGPDEQGMYSYERDLFYRNF